MGKRKTQEEAKEAIKVLGYELLSEYLGTMDNVIIKDREGYLYFPIYKSLVLDKKYPQIAHKVNPYSAQNIKLWCKLENKLFELVSDIYIDSSPLNKLQWRCLKKGCGEIFEADWGAVHGGCGCGVCHGKQVGLSNCLATIYPNLINEWNYDKNGELHPWNVSSESGINAFWKCKNGHEWNAIISNRGSRKDGCPYCSHRLPSKEYNLLIVDPVLCEEWNRDKNDKSPSEYLPHASQSVWWKCKECNHEWEAVINNRTNNRGCPECNKSKGEKEVDKTLTEKNWIKIIQEEYNLLSNLDKCSKNYFIPQKTFEDLRGVGNGLLSYDHYLPNINLLIEYQGQYHDGTVSNQTEEEFEYQKEHDRRKKEYALKNGYKFLEIWYWDFDNIEEILVDILVDKNMDSKYFV